MITVYLSTRGDVYYRCTVCDETRFVPVEFRETPFWDHYNGMLVNQMIGHYNGKHTQQRSLPRHSFPPQSGHNSHLCYGGNTK